MPTAKLFLDPTLGNAASPYYSLFPVEPTPSNSVGSWLQTEAKHIRLKSQTLSELLKLIADNAAAGSNVLIVCHGTNRGLHFYVGDTSRDVFLNIEALDAILLNLEGRETDANTEQILMLKPGVLTTLKALIRKVQALALARVDVRACDTGKSTDAMRRLQLFFNCNIFCAPKLLDSFGEVTYGSINSDPNFWQRWLKERKNLTYSGTPPHRFAWSWSVPRGMKIEALAESKKAIADWAANHLPPSNVFTAGSRLLYHGLTDAKSRLVFAGEAAFRAELVEAHRAAGVGTGLPRPGDAP